MADRGTQMPLLPHPDRKTCQDCGATYFNVYAHMEECSGPRIQDQFARDDDGA